MKNLNKIFLRLLLTCLLSISLIGCKNANEKNNPEIKTDTQTQNDSVKKLCFINEFPFKDDATLKDVQELNLSIDDDKVSGVYNWLPAQKDQRRGILTGTIKGNVIEANYTFSQEGIKETKAIKITLTENTAIINGENQELGLDATINKVECNFTEI